MGMHHGLEASRAAWSEHGASYSDFIGTQYQRWYVVVDALWLVQMPGPGPLDAGALVQRPRVRCASGSA